MTRTMTIATMCLATLAITGCAAPPQQASSSPPAAWEAPAAPATNPVHFAEPEAVMISLDRDVKVGQRWHLHANGSRQRTLTGTTDGRSQSLETQQLAVVIDADAETMAVDDLHRPTAIAYTITKCAMKLDGEAWHIAEPGALLIARRTDAGTVFEVDGVTPAPEENAALRIVAALPLADAGDDAVMGTPTARNVGDRWSIDREQAARRSVILCGMRAEPDQVFGATTVMARRRYKGQPCVALHNRTSIENAWARPEDFPPGFDLRRAFVTTVRQDMLPLGETLPALAQTRMTNFDVVFEGNVTSRGLGAELHMFGRELLTSEITPLVLPPETLARAD